MKRLHSSGCGCHACTVRTTSRPASRSTGAAGALGGAGREFEGAYGRWTLEERDVYEVLRYRGGLVAAAAGAGNAGGGPLSCGS